MDICNLYFQKMHRSKTLFFLNLYFLNFEKKKQQHGH